jgi:hypothetical protein
VRKTGQTKSNKLILPLNPNDPWSSRNIPHIFSFVTPAEAGVQ